MDVHSNREVMDVHSYKDVMGVHSGTCIATEKLWMCIAI